MFYHRIAVIAASAVLLSLAGCGSTDSTASTSSSLFGTITDTSGDPVANASVILIPASDINTTKIDILEISATATDDEPLDDLIADTTKSYQSATTNENGDYSFTSTTEGSYFIYVKPADTDTAHLPGGSLCRTTTSVVSARARKDVQISTTPSGSATYVGSTTCLLCHPDEAGVKKTGHFNGLRAPGTSSSLQDISNFSGFDSGLDKFTAETTVYYYAYDSTRGMDKYKTLESNPGSGDISFTATLLKDGDTYKVRLNNVKNPADPNEGITYDVELTYGGAIHKQRYITKIGESHFVLPVQYQNEGSESYTPRTRKLWRDYNGGYWYNETTQLLTTPAKSKAFDNNCAACHFTGFSIAGNDTDGWVAEAVSAEGGTIDYNNDGNVDEINTGCEVCHGPGSEHVAVGGGGRSIVHPGLLPPEREAMICGRCHSRPKGALGTESPVNASRQMMLPGGRRSEFLASYTNGTQLDASASDLYTDKDEHSKSHHQQYTDFIRSSKYKNDTTLLTCTSCHNLHGTNYRWQLKANPDDNSLCTTCHSDKSSVTEHTEDELGVSTDMSAKCFNCHMPMTAKSGAGEPGIGSYWKNDISSHLFVVPPKTTSIVAGQPVTDSLMPLPYTDGCGTCHDSDLSD